MIEVVGLFTKTSEYLWNFRDLFITKRAFRPINEDGLWTYPPNSRVTEAAVYHLSPFESWTEYKCTFDTNKFGLVSTNFDNQSAVDYVVLGDSFTEGQGGCPWLTKSTLERKKYPVLINAGLESAGVELFEMVADWLAQQIDVKDIIVIAISNDFKRRPGPWWHGREECLNDGRCSPSSDVFWGVDSNIFDDPVLYETSKKRFVAENHPWTLQLDATLTYHSLSWNILKKYYNYWDRAARLDQQQNSETDSIKQFEPAFQSMLRLKRRFPGMKVILVPQRDEVGFLGVENLDTKFVKAFLVQQGFDWQFCKIGMGDYMPIDGHPNGSGYEKLLACLDKALDMRM